MQPLEQHQQCTKQQRTIPSRVLLRSFNGFRQNLNAKSKCFWCTTFSLKNKATAVSFSQQDKYSRWYCIELWSWFMKVATWPRPNSERFPYWYTSCNISRDASPYPRSWWLLEIRIWPNSAFCFLHHCCCCKNAKSTIWKLAVLLNTGTTLAVHSVTVFTNQLKIMSQCIWKCLSSTLISIVLVPQVVHLDKKQM